MTIFKGDIAAVREGVADLSKRLGITQLEAACEVLTMLSGVLISLGEREDVNKAVELGLQKFAARVKDL